MIKISLAESDLQIDSIRSLFREYETWLGLELCFQGFEAELADLPSKYAEPDGRLLFAFYDGRLAGCVAMRKLDDDISEMKRLFVREDFRGLGIGVSLIERVIKDAKVIGYDKLRLDTFPPKMEKAVSLYEAYGFYPIDPYYDNPNDGVLFMERKL